MKKPIVPIMVYIGRSPPSIPEKAGSADCYALNPWAPLIRYQWSTINNKGGESPITMLRTMAMPIRDKAIVLESTNLS
jgi:hypothetical protein